eukprot:JP435789.1.p1 GENE.JP435789.1~~JP435789.1.p1  ORF type:complete len:448 (+),score=148.73 JP435789.1:182-1345(+)
MVASGKLTASTLKRLALGGAKYDGVLDGLNGVIGLSDPIGKCNKATRLDEGLDLYQVSTPLGVLCVIFEARPDAVVQIASLAIKSANAVILKGGREASNSNQRLVELIRDALKGTGVPVDTVQLVSSRDEIAELLSLDKYIDLVIPRGSGELVKHIKDNTRIPVMGHAEGLCLAFVDETAKIDLACQVLVDSKTNYPAACNSLEQVLIHESQLTTGLPAIAAAFVNAGVSMRVDEACMAVLKDLPADKVQLATAEDYGTEFLDFVVAVRVIPSLEKAVAYINEVGSHHTDLILTENKEAAEFFLSRIDSAGVYHNASTRFADGFRYGFGAEVGVSTNKTHARGPVGLVGLVTYKYRLHGHGQVAGDYGAGKCAYLHEDVETPDRVAL